MNGEAMFYEQFANFSIDGVGGKGICEFVYGPSHRPKNWQAYNHQIDSVIFLHKDEIRSIDQSLELLGGKAEGLLHLCKAGFNIPPGNFIFKLVS